MAIGWARADIMARLGYSDSGNWLTKATRVNRRTAERVTALYDRLSATPGPSRQTAAWARRHGYLPPLWWDDDTIDDPLFIDPCTQSSTACGRTIDPVVVERLIDGQPPLHVTRAERAEAVRVLDARGWTHSLIAQQLAMSGTRVAQILDGFVRPTKHTPHADNNRQEASA